jgi:hypothetical protein
VAARAARGSGAGAPSEVRSDRARSRLGPELQAAETGAPGPRRAGTHPGGKPMPPSWSPGARSAAHGASSPVSTPARVGLRSSRRLPTWAPRRAPLEAQGLTHREIDIRARAQPRSSRRPAHPSSGRANGPRTRTVDHQSPGRRRWTLVCCPPRGDPAPRSRGWTGSRHPRRSRANRHQELLAAPLDPADEEPAPPRSHWTPGTRAADCRLDAFPAGCITPPCGIRVGDGGREQTLPAVFLFFFPFGLGAEQLRHAVPRRSCGTPPPGRATSRR